MAADPFDIGLTCTVSEFVALLNQTLEYAYPITVVTGELANFKVSKNRWVYFDLKDETASVRFFGTVYHLPGPLENGMMLSVRGVPRLHPQYGFSVSVQSIRPVGEGSIKKAAALLEATLRAEGLFDEDRKRPLPYPPARIGLITSGESAAYKDFIKVSTERWGGLEVTLVDVQVQGEAAPAQIAAAIAQCNAQAVPVDVLVITRGGGSAEDLAAFSTEQVTRAVATSRIPTLVAIGHEVNLSLAELAADRRASTPSNAAEMLVPDRRSMLAQVQTQRQQLLNAVTRHVAAARNQGGIRREALLAAVLRPLQQERRSLGLHRQLLDAFDPQAALRRGYALIRHEGTVLRSGTAIKRGQQLTVQLTDARLTATVDDIMMKQEDNDG